MDSRQVATDDIALVKYTVRSTLSRDQKPPRPPRSRSKSKTRDPLDFPFITYKRRGRSSSRDPESPTSPLNDGVTLIGYRPHCPSSCQRSASLHVSSAAKLDHTTSSTGDVSSDPNSQFRSLRTSRELKMEREKRRLQLRSRSASNDSLKRSVNDSEPGPTVSVNPWLDPLILPPPKGFQDSSGSNSPPTTLSDESEPTSEIPSTVATPDCDVEVRERPKRDFSGLIVQRPKTTPLPVITQPPWTAPSLGPRRTILFPPLSRDVEFWRTSATQGRFEMRSTRSVIEYTTGGVHYRVRSELITECYQSSFDVSETESEDDDEDSRCGKPPEASSEEHRSTSMSSLNNITKSLSSTSNSSVAGVAPLRSNKSPPSPSTESARLSSSSTSTTNSSNSGSTNISGISSACSASIGSGTHEVDGVSGLNSDADSGIEGVSPRLSLDALDSNAHSPTHSLLFIDSTSPRNSCMVVDATVTRETVSECAEECPESARTTVEDVEGLRRDRAHRVALELLTTERSYVAILHLLDQVFQFRVDQENRAHAMFPSEIVPQMFSNIKSLFKLHHDFLLPKLEERLAHWEENPRLGDIMTNFAPFLKMYAEYVRNFDHSVTLITNMANKCPRFASILEEIHQLPECGGLALQHNMLTPIQRVPRYQLLLRDYLKRLPEASPDRTDTERALQLVSEAARHANEAMRKIEQFKQLLEIQEALGGAVDLVSPTRELLKEGKIVKISARSGDHQERYLFLFSDLLLLCSPRLIAATKVMGGAWPPYRLRAKFSVSQLTIMEGDNLETANTFYIRDGAKTVELYTQTVEEKEAWLEALATSMADLTRRKSSLRVSPTANNKDSSFPPADTPSAAPSVVGASKLGKVPPALDKNESVSRCTDCESQFNVVKRKHHCHACGKVVCSRCSSQKIPLAYDGYKSSKVCRACYAALSSTTIASLEDLPSSNCPSPDSEKINIHSGLLEVPVNSPSVMSGFLSLKTRGKTWTRRWFALREDFVLYSYKNSTNENRAMTATPVPGYSVALVSGDLNSSSKSSVTNGTGEEKERCFKLSHSRKSYHFQACGREDAEKWVTYLQMASKADFSQLPGP